MVLRAGKKKELLHEVNLGSSVYTTPVAKDGVLYINSRSTLFAIAEGKGKKSARAEAPAEGTPVVDEPAADDTDDTDDTDEDDDR